MITSLAKVDVLTFTSQRPGKLALSTWRGRSCWRFSGLRPKVEQLVYPPSRCQYYQRRLEATNDRQGPSTDKTKRNWEEEEERLKSRLIELESRGRLFMDFPLAKKWEYAREVFQVHVYASRIAEHQASLACTLQGYLDWSEERIDVDRQKIRLNGLKGRVFAYEPTHMAIESIRQYYTYLILQSIAEQEERLEPQPSTSAIQELGGKYQRSHKTLTKLLAYQLAETPLVDRATATQALKDFRNLMFAKGNSEEEEMILESNSLLSAIWKTR